MKLVRSVFGFVALAAAALFSLPAAAVVDYPSYPEDAIPFATSSSAVAATEIAITISAVSGFRNYVTGIDCSYNGATAASTVTATVAGLLGGTKSVFIGVPVIAAGTVLTYSLPTSPGGEAWPAVDDATDIVFTLPTLGAGNTLAACTVRGFSAREPL